MDELVRNQVTADINFILISHLTPSHPFFEIPFIRYCSVLSKAQIMGVGRGDGGVNGRIWERYLRLRWAAFIDGIDATLHVTL